MKIVHISDTHGKKWHSKLNIPECDVLIQSGDIGDRTDNVELIEFLTWFEQQPAKKKIWVAGNHDIVLDEKNFKRSSTTFVRMLEKQRYEAAMEEINNRNVIYLLNKEYVYEGIKFYGSPYSPSFHRSRWVFNADRGDEISRIWAKIPNDTNVLITHTPPYGILDKIDERYKEDENEDVHKGCEELMKVIKKRLLSLKLHCFGHIHENTGIIQVPVSNTRTAWFSNGAIMNNSGDLLYPNPFVITIL